MLQRDKSKGRSTSSNMQMINLLIKFIRQISVCATGMSAVGLMWHVDQNDVGQGYSYERARHSY